MSKPPPQLSRIILFTGSGWSEDRSLSVHNNKIAFAARINRQLKQATDHGDTEKSFLYLDPWMFPNKAAMWSNDDLRRSCRHKLRRSESDIRYYFPRSYFFPLQSQWQVNPQPALIIFIFIIVIFLMAISMIIYIVTYIRLWRPAISFEGMRVKSALARNRWNFVLLCKFRHCTQAVHHGKQRFVAICFRLSDTGSFTLPIHCFQFLFTFLYSYLKQFLITNFNCWY